MSFTSRLSHLPSQRLRLYALVPIALAWVAVASPVIAAPLPRGDLFVFPGTNPSPASARSAAFALADRWLGDEPFDNAAGALRTAISVSPLLQRISRQDLRARNTAYDETSAFIDAAGGFIAYMPGRGGWGVSFYGVQPVLRREDNAFQEGVRVEGAIPATVRATTETREVRAGLAVAWRRGNWSLGAAPEWLKRSESLTQQREGANLSGDVERWNLSIDGLGVMVSARYATPISNAHAWRVGASLRDVPKLALSGSVPQEPGRGNVSDGVTRESAWEGGVSVEVRLTPTFMMIVGGGGRTEAAWSGIAASNGASAQAAIAGEYRDPETPWSVRFGIGRESNPGTRESAASQLALGVGYTEGPLRLDVGLLHRGLERTGAPNSSDDRVVGSVTIARGSASRGR